MKVMVYVVYNEQGVPVYKSNNEIEAQNVAMLENGWYKGEIKQ